MLQSVNCIRMGQILLDENLQLFILCSNCHIDLRNVNVNEFRRHLEQCDGVDTLFRGGGGQQQLKYNDKSTQLFGKTAKGIKEFLIYDYADVEVECLKTEDNFVDLINIEQELLDPRWYSDDLNTNVNNANITQKSSKQYDVLVEEVTPFVQFKENVKSNSSGSLGGRLTNGNRSLPDLPKGGIRKKDVKQNASSTNGANYVTTKNVKATKRRISFVKISNEPASSPHQPNNLNDKLDLVTPASSSSSAHRTQDNTCQVQYPKRSKIQNTATVNDTVKLVTSVLPRSPQYMSPPTTIIPKQTPSSTNQPIAINPVICRTSNIPVIPIQQPTKEKETAQILNKLQNLGLQIKRTQPPAAAILPLHSVDGCSKTDEKTLEILLKLKSKGMKVKLVNKQQSHQSIPPAPAVNLKEQNVAIKQNFNKNLIIRKV